MAYLVNKILFEAIDVAPPETLIKKVSDIWPDPRRSYLAANPQQQYQPKLLAVIHREDYDLIPKFLEEVNKENWFPAFINVNGEKGIAFSEQNLKSALKTSKYIIISVVRDIDEEDEKERVVWHVTPIEYLKTIQSEGLKPRSLNTLDTHPDRVYFITKAIGEQQIWLVARMLFEKAKKVTKNLRGEYAWFQVDLRKHPEIKLYDDPSMAHAYYTDSPVPPECLKLLGTQDIN